MVKGVVGLAVCVKVEGQGKQKASHGAMRLDKASFSQEKEKRKRHLKEVTCLQVTLAVLLVL